MRGNFGIKLQNSPKLPHIHARFHCNSKKAELTVKRAIMSFSVSNKFCVLTVSLVLSNKEAVGSNDCLLTHSSHKLTRPYFVTVLANKVCGYHVNLLRTWTIRIFMLVGT